MHRFRFVLYRPLQLLPVLFGISIVSFVLVHAIPGDPVRAIIGPKATPEVIERVRAQYGLDQPVVVQYLRFLENVAQGEMGRSVVYKTAVVGVVAERFEATIFLLGYAVVLALCLAVPLAVTATLRRGRAPDHLIRMFSTAGLGFPAFWLGIMLMIVFSVRLGLFPVSGYGEGFLGHLHHLFLPALAIALALSAILTRNLRASLLAELDADHIAAARAKGLPARWIFVHHVFRNALIPTINLLGVNLGWLIGGTVVVETVFSVPGLGSLMVSSIFARDYMVVQAITLAFACATVLVNFVVDVVTVALDPRIEL
jgi:ABC-type dipeptide/oligopeptide/nickel transport system permease component